MSLVFWFSYLAVVQMKSKHTGIWIIHIKLKCFCWESRKTFLGQENIWITSQIFYGEIKLVNNVNIMFMLTDKYMYECLIKKSTSETGVKCFVFFTFFINFFMKTLIKNIIYCQTVPLNRLLILCCENCMAGFSVSFLIWISLAIFHLDQCQMEIVCSAQHHYHLVGEITH